MYVHSGANVAPVQRIFDDGWNYKSNDEILCAFSLEWEFTFQMIYRNRLKLEF